MKRINHRYLMSPQDIIKFIDSPYSLWMDKKTSGTNAKKLVEPPKEATKATLKESLFNEGNVFEEKIISQMIEGVGDSKVFKIEKDLNGSIITTGLKEATIDAMKAGNSVIVQAYLEDDMLYGFSDLLVRVPVPSKLGNYSYVVKDIKRSQTPKAKFVLQILCYCNILSKIQGVFPEKAYIILGNGEEEEFKTGDYLEYFKQVINSCQSFLNNEQEMPFPDKNQNHGFWQETALDFLKEKNDISLLPDITKEQIKLLRESSVNSIDELISASTSSVSTDILNRLKIQSSAYKDKRAKKEYLIYPHSKENPKGLNNLPRSTACDVYIDIKYSDSLAKEGFIFLATISYIENKAFKRERFLANSKKEEEELLKKLLTLVQSKVIVDDQCMGTVFFYGQSVLNQIITSCSYYDLQLSLLNKLIFFDRLVDLQSVVKQSLALGVESFGFEDVANHICESGFFSEDNESILYSIMLHSSNEELKKEATESFNKLTTKRVSAIVELHRWLQEVQKENEDLSFISFQDREEGKLNEVITSERNEKPEKIPKADEEVLDAKEIIGDFSFSEKSYHSASTETKVSTLVKQFGKYHNHEKFPSLLTKKTLLRTDDIYLNSDPLTLSNLTLTTKDGVLFSYSFPKQETKLDLEDKVCLKQNPSLKADVYSLDMEKREVVLKFPKKRVVFAEKFTKISIILDNELPDKMIKDKILKNIKDLNEAESSLGLNKAMSDFLFRKFPDVTGVNSGADLYTEEEDLIQAAIRVVENMNKTSLIFQGPPGAGKTYTTARIILSLIKQGKKIGISSNSHKAINNVLLKLKETDSSLKILKQQSTPDEALVKKGIDFPSSKGIDFASYQIIGGTVYAFVKDSFDDYFDYLFIDEAGQVSLANLFAMSKSAKNIILIGDQMQLEQPTQAVHPGDSGQSILEYFLNGYKTIPKSYGFFLPITRRMNPDLTKIISENFYEGKLVSHESTANNKLLLKDTKIITKETGLQFVPVSHKDNIIYSLEEVSKIKEIVEELVTQDLEIDGKVRKIVLEDIIFVSPYNMQVKKIKERIPGANAGSVDLFQGQEAPVVIISLASSLAGGRGIEFLLSENRMNVAISRGKCLAILVANPEVANSPVSTLDELKLINMFCKLIKN